MIFLDKNRIIRTILLVIVILCFGGFVGSLILNNLNKNQSDALSALKEVSPQILYQTNPKMLSIKEEDKILKKYLPLYQKNKNLTGWIKIDDTIIDYPVMKSINGNGEFYLDHNYDGKEDRNGTLFMDDNCDIKKPSTNLIIYGHNMKSGQMFGSLDNYKSEAYYKNHPVVRFDTLYREGMYQVVFAFQSRVYSEAEITFKYYQFIEPNSKEEFESAVASMKELSMYDTQNEVSYGDELLTLSTCDYDEANGRFVVVCKKIK